MNEPSGIYTTMIQQVNIPSGMFMEELGKIGPYYKYVQFPIDEEELQQWCDEYLMEYQQKLMKELEERLWIVDRFLVDRSWDYPVYCSLGPFLYKTMS